MLQPLPIRNHPDINDAPLAYWRARGYTEDEVNQVGLNVNDKYMALRVTFLGNGQLDMAVSQKTWERQEGHYPSVMQYLAEVAARPLLQNRKGSLLIWLEDGLWEWQQEYSFQAPTLCFGRHLYDNHSLVMPDPAYTNSRGYVKDVEEINQIESTIGFDQKIKTVFFRGAAVGLGIENEAWVKTARGQLCILSRDLNQPQKLDAKMTKMGHLSAEQQAILTAAGVTGDFIPFHEFLRYLYLIHADGYCCSWPSLYTKLACSSVTVRIMGEYEQWYYRDLVPWQHYVPLRPDLADFNQVFEWLINHDKEVQEIIQNAHTFLDERLGYERCLSEMEELCARVLDCQKPA